MLYYNEDTAPQGDEKTFLKSASAHGRMKAVRWEQRPSRRLFRRNPLMEPFRDDSSRAVNVRFAEV